MSVVEDDVLTPTQRAKWYSSKPVVDSRDYARTLVPRIKEFDGRKGFHVQKYGTVDYPTRNRNSGSLNTVTHDLFVTLVGDMNPEKDTHIILGGTHGYEKGGPEATLGYRNEEAAENAARGINSIIYHCVAPGPYETKQRRTVDYRDPNRDGYRLSERRLDDGRLGPRTQEMQALAQSIETIHERVYAGYLTRKFTSAVDLHETPAQDIAIDTEERAMGLPGFEIDPFPQGLFLLGFESDVEFLRRTVAHVASEGHQLVADEKIYAKPNQGGFILSPNGRVPDDGPRVRNLMAHFARVSFTTEFCGLDITDRMNTARRAEPQRAVIRGMFRHS